MSESNPNQPPIRASDADRERVAQFLHKAVAEGRISVEELEERLGDVYAAKTRDELLPPVADLPADGHAGVGVVPAASGAVDRIGGTPGSTGSLAVMSTTTRGGSWVVPPKHTSVAFWGEVRIDLRSARFAERESVINASAIMGAVEVLVPDDIIVDVTGIGIMGDFSLHNKRGARRSPAADAPTVKIGGFAFWGSVQVTRVPRGDTHDDPELE